MKTVSTLDLDLCGYVGAQPLCRIFVSFWRNKKKARPAGHDQLAVLAKKSSAERRIEKIKSRDAQGHVPYEEQKTPTAYQEPPNKITKEKGRAAKGGRPPPYSFIKTSEPLHRQAPARHYR